MSGATYTLNGNGTGAVTAIGAANAALTKTGEAADKATAATDRLAKRIEYAAQRTKEMIDPQAKLNRLYAELGQQVQANKLSIDDATRAGVMYRDQMGLSARSLQGVAAANKEAFGLGQLTSYLAHAVSIGGAIHFIRSELHAITALGERRAQTSVNVADAELKLRSNLAGHTEAEKIHAIEEAGKIASAYNLPQKETYDAMTQAVSATGNTVRAAENMRVAAQFYRNAEEIGAVAGGIGDIQNTAGIQNPFDALGFLAIAHKGSRIGEVKDVAAQLGKTIAAFTSPTEGGATPENAATGAALFAALTRAGVDKTGELTRTAAINLTQQTKDFLVKKRFKADQIDTPDERMKILLADPELGKQFVAGVKIEEGPDEHFRAAMRGAIGKLFGGDPSIRGYYDTTYREELSPDARMHEAREAIRFNNAGAIQAAGRTNDVIISGAEQLDLKFANQGLLTGEAREKFITTLAQANGSTPNWQDWNTWVRTGTNIDRNEALSEIDRAFNRDPENKGIQRPLVLTDEQKEARSVLSEQRDILLRMESSQRSKVATLPE